LHIGITVSNGIRSRDAGAKCRHACAETRDDGSRGKQADALARSQQSSIRGGQPRRGNKVLTKRRSERRRGRGWDGKAWRSCRGSGDASRASMWQARQAGYGTITAWLQVMQVTDVLVRDERHRRPWTCRPRRLALGRVRRRAGRAGSGLLSR
jgi:hypothetical protein